MDKIKKYLFESVVIFISITASLLVDEWRDSIKTKQKINEYTREFLSDVTLFQKRLDSIKSTLQLEKRYINSVLEKTYSPDSLPVMSTFPHYFKPKGVLNSATFQSIVASGDLELIRNREILVKLDIIDEHHRMLVDAINRSESTYVNKLLPILNEYGAMTEYRLMWLKGQPSKNSGLSKMIDDKRYKEILSEMHIWNLISIALVDYAITVTKDLEVNIQSELAK